MEKGKKRGLKGLVLLSIVVILIVCCFTLAACGKTTNEKNSGTNIEQSEGQGNNSGNQSEIEQGGQTGGQETGGETGGEVTPDPEKTPAEYKAECEEKITNAVAETLQAKYKLAVISDVELVKLNAKDGKIYVTANYNRGGSSAKDFYELDSNLGDISKNTYKEISQKLDSISLSNIQQNTILKGAISEEKYNDLCNYVLSDVGLEGGTVLNATKFAGTGDGRAGTTLTVLYNNKIAIVDARCSSGTTGNVKSIDYMLSSETNIVRITSYEDYKDFDYLNNEATMSAVSYNLNLGGKTVATKTASGTFNMNLSVQ